MNGMEETIGKNIIERSTLKKYQKFAIFKQLLVNYSRSA